MLKLIDGLLVTGRNKELIATGRQFLQRHPADPACVAVERWLSVLLRRAGETASTAALVLARPLGLTVQRYITTQTPNASMRVIKVSPMTVLGSPAHFVHTDNPDAAGLFS